ncbi:MAG TPA: DUF1499 domain-containing protein [Nitrospirales bacterium]|nr:DUF1499 domain-containing protein [Nitrospirales bacterium]
MPDENTLPLGMLVLLLLVSVAIAQGVREEALMVGDRVLLPCSSRPNCVSTVDAGEIHAIAPYRNHTSLNEIKDVLKQVFSEYPRMEVIKDEEDYLRYESAIFSWVL